MLNILMNRIFFVGNCSSDLGGGGGWWYHEGFNCHFANLNGEYQNPPKNNARGLVWGYFNGAYSLKKVVMKVKRKL